MYGTGNPNGSGQSDSTGGSGNPNGQGSSSSSSGNPNGSGSASSGSASTGNPSGSGQASSGSGGGSNPSSPSGSLGGSGVDSGNPNSGQASGQSESGSGGNPNSGQATTGSGSGGGNPTSGQTGSVDTGSGNPVSQTRTGSNPTGGLLSGITASSTGTANPTIGRTSTGLLSAARNPTTPTGFGLLSDGETANPSTPTGFEPAVTRSTNSQAESDQPTTRNPQSQALSDTDPLGYVLSRIRAAEGADYNTLSGGAVADITNMTIQQAVDFAATSWDGKLASVLGAYQFKDSTLKAVADYLGMPMDTKMTPETQDALAIGLMQMRADRATVDGQIDMDKFTKELSKEWASLATEDGLSYYAKNGIDKAQVSYDDTRSIAQSLVDNGVVTAKGSDAADTASSTVAADDNRFANTYLGTGAAGVRQAMAEAGQDPDDALSQSLADLNQAAYDEANGSQAVTTVGPIGTRPAEAVTSRDVVPASTSTTVAASPATESVAPTTTTETVKPATTSTTAAPANTATTATKPTLGQTVAGTAIDVGLGLIPTVGLPLSLANAGLALTGNKTIGQMVVGLGENNQSGAIDTSTYEDKGDSFGSDAEEYVPPEDETDTTSDSTVRTEDDFASTYFQGVYPTPQEKYGDRSSYASSYY